MAGNYRAEAIVMPAPLVNHTDLLFMPGIVRFTFSESYEGMPMQMRGAVTMSRDEALVLAEALVNALVPAPGVAQAEHSGSGLDNDAAQAAA